MVQLSERMEEIRSEILDEKIKVVSFDIFDTLLFRPCSFPTDMFKLVVKRCGVEETFPLTRQMAEKYARDKKPFYNDDITLEDIYKEYVELTGVTSEEADKLKNCEIQVELECLYPRMAVKELYDTAIKAGKKVIIVSDMYLSKQLIERILEKNGYTGYLSCYVSSEEMLSKGSGRLFQKIISEFQKEGIEADEIIHLGDNMHADVKVPKRYGINAIHLPNASGIFNTKKGLQPLRKYCALTDDCYLVGVLANYLFDDPYFPFDINSISGGYEGLLGSVLYGPILLMYMKWMIEESKKEGVEQLLFVYRDGYILEKIFSLMEKIYNTNFDVQRIYLSRTIRYYFYAQDQTGIIHTLGDFPIPSDMTVRSFLEKRFLLKDREEMQTAWEVFRKHGYSNIDSCMGNREQYFAVICELNYLFKKNAQNDMNTISDYCHSIIDEKKKIGILDVGYRGSVGKFIKDRFDISSNTYQIFANPKCENNKEKYRVHSFYSNGFQAVADMKILHQLTEDIISIQEGTACKILSTENGFEIQRESTDENITLSTMQEGVVDFIEYALEHLKYDFMDMCFDKTIFIDLLYDFLKRPYQRDANIIKRLNFVDANFVSMESNNNIYNVWYDEKFNKNTVKKTVEGKKVVQQIQVEHDLKSNKRPIGEDGKEISKIHYNAIKICDKLHILKMAIKIKAFFYGNKRKKEKNEKIINMIFASKYQTAISKVKEKFSRESDNRILIAASIADFDKGTCNFVNVLSQTMKDKEFILLSEANPKATEEKIRFQAVMVPDFLLKEKYSVNTGCFCTKKIRKKIDNVPYLKWGVDNLLQRHSNMEESYAYLWAYYTDVYVREVLNVIKPSCILLWNGFFAYHYVLKNICEEIGIKVSYLEFGSLPGTLSIENMGQMGESFPGKNCQEFMRLPVTDNEIVEAKKVIGFMNESKLNRNVQPINNNIDLIKEKLKPNRPTILYAGVNDYESGLTPYTNETQKYHSPYIKSSNDGAKKILKFAKKNNWNFIYKPHPRVHIFSGDNYEFDKDVIIAKDVDINDVIDISDVVVTILSQVSYASLIREKATVMLGYTQLKGKGCCYEAFQEEILEKTLTDAIDKGYTEKQRSAFEKHVAQMLKYNLYNDLTIKAIEYGQQIEAAADFIESCDDTEQWYESHCISMTKTLDK